jgi:hypothetical protein
MGHPMILRPVFDRDDPDDELVPCVFDWCEALCPLAGPTGIVRHLLAVHPETLLARGIFARLVEVQLMDADTAAEVLR